MLFTIPRLFFIKKVKNGISALPTLLLVSGIVLEITIAFSLLIYFMTQSVFGVKAASEALTAAQSGIDNAVSMILRNKDIGGAGASTSSLILDANHSVDIVICKDFLIDINSMNCSATSNPGQTEIISTGKAFSRNRRLQAFVSIDSYSGEVRLISNQEIPL